MNEIATQQYVSNKFNKIFKLPEPTAYMGSLNFFAFNPIQSNNSWFQRDFNKFKINDYSSWFNFNKDVSFNNPFYSLDFNTFTPLQFDDYSLKKDVDIIKSSHNSIQKSFGNYLDIFDNDFFADGFKFTTPSKSSSKSSSKKSSTKITVDNTKSAVGSSSWDSFKQLHKVKEITIGGAKVYGCSWTNFQNSQKEWLDVQKYMIQAAEEMGLTLVYSDMDRSVAASNAARAKKGDIVCKGGESPHNYGTAADICLFSNGKQVSSKSDLFRKFADRVRELSGDKIEWGGEWKKPDEEHHFQLRDWKKYKSSEYMIT